MVTTTDIWQIVKKRLRIAQDDNELFDLAESYIDEIADRIKNYCRISEIPDGLKYTWASMVVGALQAEQSTIEAIDNTIDTGENIKIGDTSISPVNGTGVASRQSIIDGLILNYTIDLNRYRRLGLVIR